MHINSTHTRTHKPSTICCRRPNIKSILTSDTDTKFTKALNEINTLNGTSLETAGIREIKYLSPTLETQFAPETSKTRQKTKLRSSENIQLRLQ